MDELTTLIGNLASDLHEDLVEFGYISDAANLANTYDEASANALKQYRFLKRQRKDTEARKYLAMLNPQTRQLCLQE